MTRSIYSIFSFTLLWDAIECLCRNYINVFIVQFFFFFFKNLIVGTTVVSFICIDYNVVYMCVVKTIYTIIESDKYYYNIEYIQIPIQFTINTLIKCIYLIRRVSFSRKEKKPEIQP